MTVSFSKNDSAAWSCCCYCCCCCCCYYYYYYYYYYFVLVLLLLDFSLHVWGSSSISDRCSEIFFVVSVFLSFCITLFGSSCI